MAPREREPLEILADHLLLLYLVKKANQVGNLDGKTKLQKLVYLAERNMLGRKMKGFNHYFFRFGYGPYSKELNHDKDYLAKLCLFDKVRWGLTQDGTAIVSGFTELWERNRAFIEQIDSIAEFATWSLADLKEYVYDQPHPWLKGETIRSVKRFTPILRRLSKEKARLEFVVTPGELETLDILLDREHYGDLLDPTNGNEKKASIPYPGV